MNNLNLTIAGQKFSLSLDDAVFIAESLRAAAVRPGLHHDYSRTTAIGVVSVAAGAATHATGPTKAQHFGDSNQGSGTVAPVVTDC